jgi:hypothetical protein
VTCVQPLVYSIDAVVPVLDLHQQDSVAPSGESTVGRVTQAWRWFAIISGWFLTTLVIAGFTGIIRRE